MAAPVPEMAAARVWEALAEVRTLHPMVKWLPMNKLHLTLVFLGQTDPSRVPEVAAAIERIGSQHEPFDVMTGDAGGRLGDRRGGVAWLRLAEGGHRVAQLSLDLDNAVGSHVYDEKRAPRPHLTVARGVSDEALAHMHTVATQIAMGWTVDKLVLYRSHTNPSGSVYEELYTSPLGGAEGT